MTHLDRFEKSLLLFPAEVFMIRCFLMLILFGWSLWLCAAADEQPNKQYGTFKGESALKRSGSIELQRMLPPPTSKTDFTALVIAAHQPKRKPSLLDKIRDQRQAECTHAWPDGPGSCPICG